MSQNAMLTCFWLLMAIVAVVITAATWDATRYESYNQTVRKYVGRDLPAKLVTP